ncbi:type I restriction enzyme S subunit [Maribacter spongiicola]|uniref:Type I restriction enzyme S subunit n=1 Tax=Maribacter spongiicola TaxID=1206753 RepID=A0A4R7K7P6_9FLAO|nr:restriction endonuclease subunit S [Maribacter spongiicola]TDT46941.1 type I restriction enzyme S subunit [Maribacter spongiicola]
MGELKKSPEVRFNSYTEDWQLTQLKDVSTYANGGSFEEHVKKIGKYELITLKSVDVNGNLVSSQKFIDIDAPTLPKDTLVMILSEQSPGLLGVTAQIPAPNKYVLNQRVAEIRPNAGINSSFLSMVINRNQQYFGKRGAGTKVQNISKPNVENYTFYAPEINEQNKISSLISNLDSSIKNHQTQLTKLKNLKKAMLVKMFPQEGATVPEIRFKGFDGEWESYQLGNIGNTFTGLSGKTKEDFGKGEARYIPYTNVFNNEVTDRNQLEKIEIDESQSTVHYGDVLFTTSSETPEEVGMSSVWLEKDENVYLNSFCFGYRFKEKVDNYFIAYYMRSQYFRENMKILAQGISRFNISKTKVMEIDILLPEETEQTKVGKYFTNLDKIIIGHEVQLKKLNNIKKACLTKMFVA